METPALAYRLAPTRERPWANDPRTLSPRGLSLYGVGQLWA